MKKLHLAYVIGSAALIGGAFAISCGDDSSAVVDTGDSGAEAAPPPVQDSGPGAKDAGPDANNADADAGGIATCTGKFPNPITDICWSGGSGAR